MRRMRERRRAMGLKAAVTWVARRPAPPDREMRLIQARSLALHVMVAEKVDQNPALLEIAHRNVAEWRERGSGMAGVAIRAWRKVLRLPWPRIAALLTEQSEEAVRLRRTTPFNGVLTRRETKRVYDAFRVVKRRLG
jgi:hypothetical protein